MNKETTIFIDTEDMEERYREELYKEYLEKENKQLKQENQQLQNNWNELKKWLEDEIIECKALIDTILPEFEKIMPRSSGKTLLTNEYNKQQTIIKSFEVMLCKMQELERGEE